MNRKAPILLTAALFTFATLAHAADVRTDFNHSANFSQFHTYSWGQVKASNPLNEQRIKRAIDADLSAKGWQLQPSGGSTTVFAIDNVKDEKSVETMYDGMGGGWGGGWGWGGWGGGWGDGGFGGMGESTSNVVNQRVGHLVVDIFNSSDHKLLFRGIASNDLSNNSSKNTKNLDKDIDKMLKDFPPKPKS